MCSKLVNLTFFPSHERVLTFSGLLHLNMILIFNVSYVPNIFLFHNLDMACLLQLHQKCCDKRALENLLIGIVRIINTLHTLSLSVTRSILPINV